MSKIAFVPGAAGGIGRAVCHRLARDGFRILGADLIEQSVQQIINELPGRGHHAAALDVSNEDAVTEFYASQEANLGPISVVVAIAGILILDTNGQRCPITEMQLAEWEKTQTINSTGAFLLLREFLRCRKINPVDSARFIGFSSVAAQLGGFRSSAAYIASKSAVLGLMKAGAREGAEYGVLVNTIAPGLIDAPMLRLSLDPDNDNQVAAAIPQGRLGTPEDVAGSVSFLAGPDSAYMTGSVLDVNGGYRMQ